MGFSTVRKSTRLPIDASPSSTPMAMAGLAEVSARVAMPAHLRTPLKAPKMMVSDAGPGTVAIGSQSIEWSRPRRGVAVAYRAGRRGGYPAVIESLGPDAPRRESALAELERLGHIERAIYPEIVPCAIMSYQLTDYGRWYAITLPCSDDIRCASSSVLRSTSSFNLNITRARRCGFVAAQAGCAACAAATARSRSAWVPSHRRLHLTGVWIENVTHAAPPELTWSMMRIVSPLRKRGFG